MVFVIPANAGIQLTIDWTPASGSDLKLDHFELQSYQVD